MLVLISTSISLLWSLIAFDHPIRVFFRVPLLCISFAVGIAYLCGLNNWAILAWLIFLIPMSYEDIRTKSIRITDLAMVCVLSTVGQTLHTIMIQLVIAIIICSALIGVKWCLKQWYKQDVFGGADIIVIGSMVIALSMKECIVGIYIAILASALIGGIVVMVFKQSKQTLIPFIPFLTLGSWLSAIYGTTIYNLYQSLI